ncbi:MAG: hypothetical protein GF350_08240 [Chitinivibrionales bacterium]|nr:hypothetical protein [Chitinivibrionales bacterium]
MTAADNKSQSITSPKYYQVLATYQIGNDAQVTHTAMAADRIAFVSIAKSTSRVECYDYNGRRTFQLEESGTDFTYAYAELSDSGNVIVVDKNFGPEGVGVAVYDLQTNAIMFERQGIFALSPSPNGRLFVNGYTETGGGCPFILRKDGTLVKELKEYRANWVTRFVNDTVLALADSTSLNYYSALTGDLLRDDKLEGYGFWVAPIMRVLSSESKVVVYNSTIITIGSLDSGIEHKIECPDVIRQVIVSSDSEWMAVLLSKKDETNGYLRFISSADPTLYVDTPQEEYLGNYTSTGFQPYDFVGNILAIGYPRLAGDSGIRDDIDYKTHLYEFNPKTKQVSKGRIIDGRIHLAKINPDGLMGLQQQAPHQAVMVYLGEFGSKLR